MTNEATIEKLNSMKLFGIARAFQNIIESKLSDNYSNDEFLGHLVDSEWDYRYNRRLDRLLSAARFRYKASMEQLDFNINRNLNKSQILRFSNCDWIKKNQDIIITGPTGAGKSFLACAFGHLACTNGYLTNYFNFTKLFSHLKMSQADGSYLKEIKKIAKSNLLIIDDFGIEPLDQPARMILLEILEDRHGKQSTIFTSQVPVKKWHELISEPTLADAICDRIVHSSHRLELKGESLRKKFVEKPN